MCYVYAYGVPRESESHIGIDIEQNTSIRTIYWSWCFGESFPKKGKQVNRWDTILSTPRTIRIKLNSCLNFETDYSKVIRLFTDRQMEYNVLKACCSVKPAFQPRNQISDNNRAFPVNEFNSRYLRRVFITGLFLLATICYNFIRFKTKQNVQMFSRNKFIYNKKQ